MLSPPLEVAVREALVGVGGGVGELVDLEREPVAVARQEQQHDRHQDQRRLLAPLPELGRALGLGAGARSGAGVETVKGLQKIVLGCYGLI